MRAMWPLHTGHRMNRQALTQHFFGATASQARHEGTHQLVVNDHVAFTLIHHLATFPRLCAYSRQHLDVPRAQRAQTHSALREAAKSLSELPSVDGRQNWEVEHWIVTTFASEYKFDQRICRILGTSWPSA